MHVQKLQVIIYKLRHKAITQSFHSRFQSWFNNNSTLLLRQKNTPIVPQVWTRKIFIALYKMILWIRYHYISADSFR